MIYGTAALHAGCARRCLSAVAIERPVLPPSERQAVVIEESVKPAVIRWTIQWDAHGLAFDERAVTIIGLKVLNVAVVFFGERCEVVRFLYNSKRISLMYL